MFLKRDYVNWANVQRVFEFLLFFELIILKIFLGFLLLFELSVAVSNLSSGVTETGFKFSPYNLPALGNRGKFT